MERSEVLEAMGELKLVAPEARVPRDDMRGAYDEIVATAVKRQHEPQRVIADLLKAEINEKKARSSGKPQRTSSRPLRGRSRRGVAQAERSSVRPCTKPMGRRTAATRRR